MSAMVVFKAWVSAIEGRNRIKNMIGILKSFNVNVPIPFLLFNWICSSKARDRTTLFYEYPRLSKIPYFSFYQKIELH